MVNKEANVKFQCPWCSGKMEPTDIEEVTCVKCGKKTDPFEAMKQVVNHPGNETLRAQKTVDDREPPDIRTKLLELGWTQGRLYSADYMFWTINFKKVGLERKAINDLLASFGERFSEQLFRMLEHFDFSILLIEGSWRNIRGSVVTPKGMEFYQWSTIWNFLRTWQDRGLTLEITSSEGHTVRRLNELYAYYQKTQHIGGLTRKVAGDPRILALQCGGIGPKLGTALLDKFGSLKNLANANMEEYAEIDKIGMKKARAIYDHFNKGSSDANMLELEGEND